MELECTSSYMVLSVIYPTVVFGLTFFLTINYTDLYFTV